MRRAVEIFQRKGDENKFLTECGQAEWFIACNNQGLTCCSKWNVFRIAKCKQKTAISILLNEHNRIVFVRRMYEALNLQRSVASWQSPIK